MDPLDRLRSRATAHPVLDLRHLLHRSRAPHVVLGLLLAATSATLVVRADARATEAVDRWSTTAVVVQATRDLPPGHRLSTADVELRSLPRVAVATNALDRSDWLRANRGGESVITARSVDAGSPLTPDDLQGRGLPVGDASIVAIAVDPLTPELRVGDRVRVVDLSDLDADRPVRAVVVRVVEGTRRSTLGPSSTTAEQSSAWLAVDFEDAPRLRRLAAGDRGGMLLDAPDPPEG